MTRIRDDKDWKTAINLDELNQLYKTSKEKTDVSLLNKLAETANDDEPPVKKLKISPSKISPGIKEKKHLNGVTKIDKFLTNKGSPKKRKLNNLDSTESSDTLHDTESIDIKFQLLPNNPLPDAFLDKKIGFYPDFISIPEDERRFFERHWIAYGGVVVKAIKSPNVDYLVHNDDCIEFSKMQKLKNKCPPDVRHVTKNWLKNCINNIKLCDSKYYPVTVLP